MKRDNRLYLKDILDCMVKIEEFVKEMDFENFIKDDKTVSAVVRKLEVIGEATKNIPEAIKKKHKDIPWRDMARMRDKIIHFYFGVDYEIVWKVIKERLPKIKPLLKKVLKEL